MLEVVGVTVDDALIAAWRERVLRAVTTLDWSERASVARRHLGGASLAMAAPLDQLFLATEINEWALCAALLARDPQRWTALESTLAAQTAQASTAGGNLDTAELPVLHEAAAMARFGRLKSLESRPKLQALTKAAAGRGLPYVLDDSELTLGAGKHGQSFRLDTLPDSDQVRWQNIQPIPIAMVTGSNGKTTSVRLIAACARHHGWRAGYNCTDGVFLNHEAQVLGDYSGPEGARRVIRDPAVEAAILETARGGILRRGIAVSRVDVALVTNVSADHYGEYGIYDLAGLAAVKLAVAGVVKSGGLLVLNADDAELQASADLLAKRFGNTLKFGWFSAEPDSQALQAYQAQGACTCGPRAGRLYLQQEGLEFDLGATARMPLSLNDVARYNIANLAGAALTASALGIKPESIAETFSSFGARLIDNPGRLMRFERGGVRILIDYAHNADGLRGFLKVAEHVRAAQGRLGLLLGHAGNRTDADIRELAQVAATFHPQLVVLKENDTQLRGRAPGEVPQILHEELKRIGLPDAALRMASSELEAARIALSWAKSSDVLALPLHSREAREAVIAMLT